MWEYVIAIVAIATLVINIIVLFVGTTWKVANVKATLRAEWEEKLEATRKSFYDEVEKAKHDFGETGGAIRQKIHEVETWARDEFVRKGSFENGMGRVEKMLGDQFAKIEMRMERMEKKIDDKM